MSKPTVRVSIDFFQKHHFQVNRPGSYPIFSSTYKLALLDADDYIKTAKKQATIVDSVTQELIWPQVKDQDIVTITKKDVQPGTIKIGSITPEVFIK